MHPIIVENQRVVVAALSIGGAVALLYGFVAQSPLSLLVFVVFVVLAFVSWLRGGLSVVSPLAVTVGTAALTYATRPLQLVWLPSTVTYVDRLEPSAFVPALVMAIAFLGCFACGYALSAGVWLAHRTPVPQQGPWSDARVKRGIVMLALAACILYALMLRQSGFTLIGALTSPGLFRSQSSTGGLFYVSGGALWALWATFYVGLVHAATTRRLKNAAAWLVGLFVTLSFLTWPYGARGFLIAPLLGFIWVLESVRPERPFRLLNLAPAALALLLFVGAYGVYREANSLAAPTATQLLEQIVNEGAGGILARVLGRFDSFDFMVWVVERYPTERAEFLLGRSAIDFLVQPLPRSVFPTKPSQTSTYLMEALQYDYDRSFTPEFGLVTECYINLWWGGVILGGVWFGFIVRALETYLQRARNSPAILLAYAPVVTIPMGWFLGGMNSFASILFVMNAVMSFGVNSYLRRSH